MGASDRMETAAPVIEFLWWKSKSPVRGGVIWPTAIASEPWDEKRQGRVSPVRGDIRKRLGDNLYKREARRAFGATAPEAVAVGHKTPPLRGSRVEDSEGSGG